MKTSSNKKQNILLLVFLVAVLALAAIFFTACMSDEEAFNKYGKANAFAKSSSGAIRHVEGPVNFYLDTSLTGRYLSAAKYAIAKANAISSQLTVTGNGSVDSIFSIYLRSEHPTGKYLGYAYTWVRSDGSVSFASIDIYKDAFPWYSTNAAVKYTFMHEIGHVLGLAHCDSKVESESLMDSTLYDYWFSDSDYGRFDKENIRWYYENH